jgi:hypothetical protein
MNRVLMSTIILSVALKAVAAAQTEKAPQPPEMEEATYAVRDGLLDEFVGLELWRRNKSTTNIYTQGNLVYVAIQKEAEVGLEDVGIPLGVPYINKILIPVNPRRQLHGTVITAKHLTIQKGSRETEEAVMVITVEREPSLVTLTYEVHDGEHMNRTIQKFSPTSDLPTTVEYLYFRNGELMEHQVKTKQK